MKQIGGFVKIDDSITSFEAIHRMIDNPGSTISHISYTSLNGFIFKLTVPEGSHEFFGLNDDGNFNKPIHSIVLKFAILSHSVEHLDAININYERHNKNTELLPNFHNEAKVQQNIYIKTIHPSGNPICPAVIDFSYLNNSSSQLFLDVIRRKPNTPESSTMLRYIYSRIRETSDRKLGIISMELADNFDTLNNLFLKNKPAYEENVLNTLAQIIILFTKLKMINYDSHLKNVLTNGRNKTMLIDFGRTVDLSRTVQIISNRDAYQRFMDLYKRLHDNKYEYETAANNITQYSITDLYVSKTNPISEVIVIVDRLIRHIANIDYALNAFYFNGIIEPQMNEYLIYLFGANFSDDWKNNYPSFPDIENSELRQKIIKIIEKIREITETPIEARTLLSQGAIQRKIDAGKLFMVDNDVSLYNRSQGIIEREREQRQQQQQQQREQQQIQLQRQTTQENTIYGIIGIAVVGYVLKYLFFGGNSLSKSKQLTLNKEKITKIVFQLLSQYNCGIEFDYSHADIQKISREELNFILEKYDVVIGKEKTEYCSVNPNIIQVPPIEFVIEHVKKQLKVNSEIRNYSRKNLGKTGSKVRTKVRTQSKVRTKARSKTKSKTRSRSNSI
jgi:hypothetical protein